MDSITRVPTSGGIITVTGANFGNNASQIELEFVGHIESHYYCRSVVFITPHYEFTCELDSGVGSNLQTVLYHNNHHHIFYYISF